MEDIQGRMMAENTKIDWENVAVAAAGSLRWDDLTTSHQLQLGGIFRPTVPQQDKGRKRCGACHLKTWNFVGTFSPVPGYTLTCPKFSLEGEPKGERNLPYQGPRLLEAVDHRLRELALALPAEASTSHTCPLLSGRSRCRCLTGWILDQVLRHLADPARHAVANQAFPMARHATAAHCPNAISLTGAQWWNPLTAGCKQRNKLAYLLAIPDRVRYKLPALPLPSPTVAEGSFGHERQRPQSRP